MNERERILDNIENFGWFFIPSRRSIFSTAMNVSESTATAKQLFREGLIDWMVSFNGDNSTIILGKPREFKYDLSDKEKERILKRIDKTKYYTLINRKKSKLKNWSDYLYFLKDLSRQGKLDWHIDFREKKYLFRKLD